MNYPFPNLTSNHRGFNNDSGLIYTRQNGMTQYEGKPIFGITQLPTPTYVNKQNIEQLLKSMNDRSKQKKTGGKILTIKTPESLAYGGSAMRGNFGMHLNFAISISSKKGLFPHVLIKITDNKTN